MAIINYVSTAHTRRGRGLIPIINPPLRNDIVEANLYV